MSAPKKSSTQNNVPEEPDTVRWSNSHKVKSESARASKPLYNVVTIRRNLPRNLNNPLPVRVKTKTQSQIIKSQSFQQPPITKPTQNDDELNKTIVFGSPLPQRARFRMKSTLNQEKSLEVEDVSSPVATGMPTTTPLNKQELDKINDHSECKIVNQATMKTIATLTDKPSTKITLTNSTVREVRDKKKIKLKKIYSPFIAKNASKLSVKSSKKTVQPIQTPLTNELPDKNKETIQRKIDSLISENTASPLSDISQASGFKKDAVREQESFSFNLVDFPELSSTQTSNSTVIRKNYNFTSQSFETNFSNFVSMSPQRLDLPSTSSQSTSTSPLTADFTDTSLIQNNSKKMQLRSKIPKPSKELRNKIESKYNKHFIDIFINNFRSETNTEKQVSENSGASKILEKEENFETGNEEHIQLERSRINDISVASDFYSIDEGILSKGCTHSDQQNALKKISNTFGDDNDDLDSAISSLAITEKNFEVQDIMYEDSLKSEDQEDDSQSQLKSSSTNTLFTDPSSSGVFSESSLKSCEKPSVDEPFKSVKLRAVQPLVHKDVVYSISLTSNIRKIRHDIALQTFRKLLVCSVYLPPEMRRTNTTFLPPYVEKQSKSTDSSILENKIQTRQEILSQEYTFDIKPNQQPPISRLHDVVSTIEQLESILERILTLGFNVCHRRVETYENSEVPPIIHSAVTDIKTFLNPLKIQFEYFGNNGYFEPFIDSVKDALNPVYNHLKESIVVLQNPAAHRNFQRVRLDGQQFYQYEADNDSRGSSDSLRFPASSFMSDTLNAFNRPSGFRIPQTHRPCVTPIGLIEIPFYHNITVALTLDLGIMVMNKADNVTAVLSADGQLAGLQFRYGECFQRGNIIDITCIDALYKIDKRARISPKGVHLQAEASPLTYIVTIGGISTSQAEHIFINHDFLGEIFYSGSNCGPEYIQDCIELLNFAKHEYSEDGVNSWFINNLVIKQNPDGVVILHRCNAEFTIIITPNVAETDNLKEQMRTNSARMTTPAMHATCSVTTNDRGAKHHLYVRQERKKLFVSDEKFVARNSSQTAGIDKNRQIVLNVN